MILGKLNITTQFNSSIRNVRYTFTDNLDGSNPKKESLKSSQFGNINNTDLMFFRLTLTYTLEKTMLLCRLKQ
jgi:hypothetical protein